MSAVVGRDRVGQLVLRHLDAAYNLGHWLLGNDQDAADAVHDAFVRATRSASTYAGGDERAWWLTIVRNCCLVRLHKRGHDKHHVAIDEDVSIAERYLPRSDASDVEDRLDQAQRRNLIERALQKLPAEFREALILRELEELSYREIADVLQTPIGTVMSRLARGRSLLQKTLARDVNATEQTKVSHGL